MKAFLAAALALVWAGGSSPAAWAQAEDFERRCAVEGQRLWGRPLCAPVVIVDPSTGAYRTTRPAPGPLPPLRANTAFDWAGEKWVMVLEPLPGDPSELAALLFHEAWHAHQSALGFEPNMAVAAHLDDPVARYLMRLEWRALAEALRSQGAARRTHAAQALAFRERRLAGAAQARDSEREQMRHEGLAAYTGIAASGAPLRLALEALARGPAQPSLGRSFAYASGPAWGLLLDSDSPGWRDRVRRGRDLPDLMSLRAAARPRPDDYGGSALLAEEHLAGFERRQRLAALMETMREDRSLRLPLAQMNMDFDPGQVTPAPDGSSFYHRITLGDRWGKVSGTPLRIAGDWSVAFAPWPLAEGALELADGWRIEERAEGGAILVRD